MRHCGVKKLLAAGGGPGLRFAVPRLQSSNDKTPPKSDAIGEDHHADPQELQAALKLEGGLVMQESLVPALPLEDELAGEDDHARKLLADIPAEFLRRGHDLLRYALQPSLPSHKPFAERLSRPAGTRGHDTS